MRVVRNFAVVLALLVFGPVAVANVNWLPVIATSPETGVQYGILAIQNLDDEAVDGKLSSIQYIAVNSTEDQQQFVLRPTIYRLDNKLKMTPQVNYSSFPAKFYGISNDAPDSDEELYTSEFLKINFALQYNFYSNFHIKLLRSIDDREITEFEAGGQIEPRITSGDDIVEYKLKSRGLGLIWDTRDFPNYPSKGFYTEIRQENFKGGIYEYSENTIDLRAFYEIAENRVFAAQAIHMEQDNDDGAIPFINLASIGGRSIVRGVFEGQYRGTEMEALQFEYRIDGYNLLEWDAGYKFFVASGRVDASEFIADDPDDLHSAVGIGGHFFFNPEDKTTLRLDMAYGDEGASFYFMIDQAF